MGKLRNYCSTFENQLAALDRLSGHFLMGFWGVIIFGWDVRLRRRPDYGKLKNNGVLSELPSEDCEINCNWNWPKPVLLSAVDAKRSIDIENCLRYSNNDMDRNIRSFLDAISRLASHYREMGEWDNAEALFPQALALTIRLKGPEHVDVMGD